MKDIFPFYSIGHFINQPHNPTKFEITRFDEMEEPDVDEVHKHSFYEIIWIETGKSRQVIDYTPYDMQCGSLFFISPGQLHEFEAWKPVTGGSILFTEDFFLLNTQQKDKLFELTFLDNVYANPSLTPDKDSFYEIKNTIDWLLKEHRRKEQSEDILRSLLQILLAQIQRCLNEHTQKHYSGREVILFKNFKILLDQHFINNWTANTYAEKLHISQHHLNMAVKQVTGKTTSQVIRGRAILEAKRMLAFTDLTVSEIALHLNYFDSSYFARLFKTDTGASPLEFRNSATKKTFLSGI